MDLKHRVQSGSRQTALARTTNSPNREDMGTRSANSRTHAVSTRLFGSLAAVIVVVGLVTTIGACTQGERLVGPSVYVQNDSGRAILVRAGTTTWAIGLEEIVTLKPQLPRSTIGLKWTYEIVDAASCQISGTIIVDFGALADPYIVVPTTGAATALEGGYGPPVSIAPSRPGGDVDAAPDPCAAQPTSG